MTDNTLIKHAIESDIQSIAEIKAVREWLEGMKNDNILIEERKGWLPTTNKKSDMDAQERGIRWSIQDQSYTKELIKSAFELIRQGKIQEAADVCERCDHPWLSAMILGMCPWRDNRIDDECDTIMPKGNRNRLLFKEISLKALNTRGLYSYERALIGALCNQVEYILPVCSSWEDKLWAYSFCLMEEIINSVVSSQGQYTSTEPSSFPISHVTWSDVFSRLKPLNVYEQVQKCVIMNDIDELAKLDIHSNDVRFVLHVLIHFNVNCPLRDQLTKEYLKQLSREGQKALVALYCNMISDPIDRNETLCGFYSCVTEDKIFRLDLLERARECGFDVESVVAYIVDKIIEKESISLSHGCKPSEEAIRSVEWLSGFSSFGRVCDLVRLFLSYDHFEACERIVNTLQVENCDDELNQFILLLEVNRAYCDWNQWNSSKGTLDWKKKGISLFEIFEKIFFKLITNHWLRGYPDYSSIRYKFCGQFIVHYHQACIAMARISPHYLESSLRLITVITDSQFGLDSILMGSSYLEQIIALSRETAISILLLNNSPDAFELVRLF